MSGPDHAVSGSTSVDLIGVGVIGSHLVQHLGRMKGIGRVTLVDPDTYSTRNLATQQITARDPGSSKAEVQARRLKEINPDLPVMPIAAAVEKVPRGRLRADIVLSALDSRRARQQVNTIAWRLGQPWIDAGVEADGRLVRINTYFPSEDGPCQECQWSDADYETLEQVYPCDDGTAESHPTGGSSSLGALAAALQAIELNDLLSGRLERSPLGREVVLSAGHHKVYVTSFRRNPGCRLHDHGVWTIERLARGPGELSLGDVLRLGPDGAATDRAGGLRVEGSRFLTRLTCLQCRDARPLLRLEASLVAEDLECPSCGERMGASGFDKIERLGPSSVPDLSLDRTLASIGLRPGDVVSVGVPGGENHLEIGGCDG